MPTLNKQPRRRTSRGAPTGHKQSKFNSTSLQPRRWAHIKRSIPKMDTSWSSLLKSNRRHLAEMGSRIKGVGNLFGYVVDYSKELVLLHRLDLETFSLNGYTVLRDVDIGGGRFFDNAEFWQYRAARHLKLKPILPVGIVLESIPTLLESISLQYPLMALHPERIKPNVCYIGALLSVSKATCSIDDLSSDAIWSGHRRLRFDDITRIDFGGGYEGALGIAARKRPNRKILIEQAVPPNGP